jgi:hypothetical protein
MYTWNRPAVEKSDNALNVGLVLLGYECIAMINLERQMRAMGTSKQRREQLCFVYTR